MTLDKKELKKAFNSIPKTRQDQYVDQRSYIIGAMYYGCGMTEQAVADFLGTCRNRVHHNKINALKFKNDQSFVNNTATLKKKFPYEVKVRLKKNVIAKRIISLHSIFGKRNGYTIALDEKLCKNLEKYSRVCGTRNAESTIRKVLIKFFEEWEE
jgi:hypothetical protein